MFSVMGLGMQTEQSCCGAFTVAVGIIGLTTAKEGQTDVDNMEGYRMIAELTNFEGQILWGAIPAAFGEEVVVGNNERLLLIGWQPKYTLDEGLIQTINWWEEHNKEIVNV